MEDSLPLFHALLEVAEEVEEVLVAANKQQEQEVVVAEPLAGRDMRLDQMKTKVN